MREEPVLHPGEQIRIPDQQQSGQIVQKEATRLYRVRTEYGRELRRNRCQLQVIPEEIQTSEQNDTRKDTNNEPSTNIPVKIPIMNQVPILGLDLVIVLLPILRSRF